MEIMTRLNWILKNMINSHKRAVTLVAAALTLTVCLMGIFAEGNIAEASHKVDRHFVDSLDGTGYYVDVNTINVQENMVTVDVYMVKALYNTMYCYGTVFNLPAQSYQYTYTKIYQYETKKLTSYSEVPSMAYGYTNVAAGNNMIMAEVLRFCYEWSQGHQDSSNNTDVGEYLD
ncbi:hypothetical protein D081_0426 [Anaerovibrio sp. JC8]|uniref:hypothetical protein n=1 Tax=Anaerovibrio sp. JC8 TaxID=1240085 RepID=UPI000A0A1D81|nr:hypothetical protein [Anaerovibrio sp. JC8]ORU00978.1 hypothetical protein D081_0426 [Anaerovibrio sp. JC8]